MAWGEPHLLCQRLVLNERTVQIWTAFWIVHNINVSTKGTKYSTKDASFYAKVAVTSFSATRHVSHTASYFLWRGCMHACMHGCAACWHPCSHFLNTATLLCSERTINIFSYGQGCVYAHCMVKTGFQSWVVAWATECSMYTHAQWLMWPNSAHMQINGHSCAVYEHVNWLRGCVLAHGSLYRPVHGGLDGITTGSNICYVYYIAPFTAKARWLDFKFAMHKLYELLLQTISTHGNTFTVH